jgi:radical SAM superfamily enzyme YgiQ (UPF0313 family)
MTERFLYRYPKDRSRLRAAVLFPNAYGIGMSNLGFQAIYHLLQSRPEIQVERAFLDENGRAVTVESGHGLESFDAVFASIAFEGDLPGLAAAFRKAGIPLDPAKRERPFIAVGGIGASILPRYLARFADAIACGDAPLCLPPLVDALMESKGNAGAREILRGIEGIRIFDEITESTLPYCRGKSEFLPHTVVLSDGAEFADIGLIQVSESCRFHCAFCLVGSAYGEYTPVPLGRILETAERYRGITDRIGLVAATLTNHPQFREIVKTLNAKGFRLSFSAFRVEGLDDEMLSAIIENENRTLVIAPETASERLKKAVRKFIPNDLAVETVRRACRVGIKRLKLYFLVGLPGEDESDLAEMVKLVTEIRAASQEQAKTFGYIPEIIVDINPLVPKPLTAFAGQPMEEVSVTKKKIIWLKNRLRSLGRTFVYGESPKNAFLQHRIANGLAKWEEIAGE